MLGVLENYSGSLKWFENSSITHFFQGKKLQWLLNGSQETLQTRFTWLTNLSCLHLKEFTHGNQSGWHVEFLKIWFEKSESHNEHLNDSFYSDKTWSISASIQNSLQENSNQSTCLMGKIIISQKNTSLSLFWEDSECNLLLV